MAGSGPPPPPANYKQDISQYLGALRKAMPGLVGLEGKYRDDFGSMNLADVQGMLGGYKGQMGLMGLNNLYGDQAGQQLRDLRRDDLTGMHNMTAQTRNILQDLTPEGQAMLNQSKQLAEGSLHRLRNFNEADPSMRLMRGMEYQTRQAQDRADHYGQRDPSAWMVHQAAADANVAQQAAKGLTGSERRTAQQFAREGAADRGRVMDNSAMAAEVLNRDDVLARKRAEASALTTNAYNMGNQFNTQLRAEAAGMRGDAANMASNLFNQRFGAAQSTNQNAFNQANQFYTQPGLQALTMTPQGYQAGQNMLGMGLSAIGQNTPQLVDLGMGFNLGAAERQNLAGMYAANQAASAARAAGKDAKMGSLFEAGGKIISSFIPRPSFG